MTLADAQAEMRRAYLGGGIGAMVSGLVWLAAALVERSVDVAAAFTVLFVGGMFIFPLALGIEKLFFRRTPPSKENKLDLVALESTIAMIGGLFAAWLLLRYDPALVLPLAAIAVGTHYFVFKTVYGDRTYWLLAAVMTAIGFAGVIAAGAMAGTTAFAIAAVELGFGVYLAVRAPR